MQQMKEVNLKESNLEMLKNTVFNYLDQAIDFMFLVLAELEEQL